MRTALLRAAGELAFLLLWFWLFTRLDAVVGTDFAAANADASALQAIEHAIHLDVERSVNDWLAGHPVLGHLAVYVYRLYYVVVAGVLVWVFARRAAVYRAVRRTMVAMTALVLLVYWAVPMAPPRSALPGAVDIVARYDILGEAGRASWTHPTHYTAMPSMHVGWSLWCAYAVWTALQSTHPRAAWAAWAFPALMVAVVLGTGNHYVLDVAGSVALLAVSIGVASLWGRFVARPASGFLHSPRRGPWRGAVR
ncbi:phosphatase PAP2 family protein [Amycolatopsis sp. cmx-4-61]|uniref:phosphatase PAP2 family protein n=1 Tax=Amycolatopsis sp. cmx-4-61 TaxID=2790937 RepID=UPI00397D6297